MAMYKHIIYYNVYYANYAQSKTDSNINKKDFIRNK